MGTSLIGLYTSLSWLPRWRVRMSFASFTELSKFFITSASLYLFVDLSLRCLALLDTVVPRCSFFGCWSLGTSLRRVLLFLRSFLMSQLIFHRSFNARICW